MPACYWLRAGRCSGWLVGRDNSHSADPWDHPIKSVTLYLSQNHINTVNPPLKKLLLLSPGELRSTDDQSSSSRPILSPEKTAARGSGDWLRWSLTVSWRRRRLLCFMIRIIIQRIRRSPPREENTVMRMRGTSEPEYSKNSVSELLSLMRIFNAKETFKTKAGWINLG